MKRFSELTQKQFYFLVKRLNQNQASIVYLKPDMFRFCLCFFIRTRIFRFFKLVKKYSDFPGQSKVFFQFFLSLFSKLLGDCRILQKLIVMGKVAIQQYKSAFGYISLFQELASKKELLLFLEVAIEARCVISLASFPYCCRSGWICQDMLKKPFASKHSGIF